MKSEKSVRSNLGGLLSLLVFEWCQISTLYLLKFTMLTTPKYANFYRIDILSKPHVLFSVQLVLYVVSVLKLFYWIETMYGI